MLLEMQNVVKRFGGLTAVSNMSFQVEKGEIFGSTGSQACSRFLKGISFLTDSRSAGRNPIRLSMGVSPVRSRISAFSRG